MKITFNQQQIQQQSAQNNSLICKVSVIQKYSSKPLCEETFMQRYLQESQKCFESEQEDEEWEAKDGQNLNFFLQNGNDFYLSNPEPLNYSQIKQLLDEDNSEQRYIKNFINSINGANSHSNIQASESSKVSEKNHIKIQPGKRPAKKEKSSEYSKSYRERKKEWTKSLQEENIYLKKKVDQLQNRLREKQLELNRIKCSSDQDGLSIQQLNEEVMKKLSLFVGSPPKTETMKEENDEEFKEKERHIKEFHKFYDIYGLGGKKTKQILDYYTNEFLQNVLRDRQKYNVIHCLKNPDEKRQKTSLEIAFMQAFEPSEQQLQRHLIFYNIMRPITRQLKVACQQFYRSSRKVVQVLECMHQMTKNEYSQNIHLLRKRMKIVIWFQINQHRREMRDLRGEWIRMVKDAKEDENQDINFEIAKKKSH